MCRIITPAQLDYGEIFGMYAADAQSAHSLLSVTLANMFAKAPLIQEVIYFTEDHEQIACQAALDSGFRDYGLLSTVGQMPRGKDARDTRGHKGTVLLCH